MLRPLSFDNCLSLNPADIFTNRITSVQFFTRLQTRSMYWVWLLRSSKVLLCYCQTEHIYYIYSNDQFVNIFFPSYIFIFALFFPFLFIPMPCPNFIGQFESQPIMVQREKRHGIFWDASSFSSGRVFITWYWDLGSISLYFRQDTVIGVQVNLFAQSAQTHKKHNTHHLQQDRHHPCTSA